MLLKFLNQKVIEAGCDEAGRGSLAGPVFAAAVILPPDFENEVLDDSKKLSKKQREDLRFIIEQEAIAYGVAYVDSKTIDKINILNASFLAMHKAIDKLEVKPELLLIDGNRFNKYSNIPHKCIIKGDGKYASIAAASVLAKTYRDDYMNKIHKEFPDYNWNKNKGYPTKSHRDAILKNGYNKYHRMTYKLLDKQLKINWDL
ncbi:MAG: ribonuclease HII [Bacteroidales bacterium]|nr:ribonuclease HII [Bacteroidales bacterium]